MIDLTPIFPFPRSSAFLFAQGSFGSNPCGFRKVIIEISVEIALSWLPLFVFFLCDNDKGVVIRAMHDRLTVTLSGNYISCANESSFRNQQVKIKMEDRAECTIMINLRG